MAEPRYPNIHYHLQGVVNPALHPVPIIRGVLDLMKLARVPLDQAQAFAVEVDAVFPDVHKVVDVVRRWVTVFEYQEPPAHTNDNPERGEGS